MDSDQLLQEINSALSTWGEQLERLNLQVAQLREENAELRDQVAALGPATEEWLPSGQKGTREWLPPKDAATTLGVSSRALFNFRIQGKFRPKSR